MASDEVLKYKWETYVVWVLRVVIGAVFILSGFVKGIDTWGVEYKIHDYLLAFDWMWAMPYVSIFSILLPFVEFLLGVWLFVGSFRRFTVVALSGVMLFMLPLTGYIAVANPVEDCGCFGDAFVMSNWASFFKNVLISAGLVFLYTRNSKVRSLYGPAVQWMTVLLPGIYLLLVILLGFYQPLLDFRPYKVGTRMSAGDSAGSDFLFIYEKGGERKAFAINELPDSTWTFVEREQVEAKVDNVNKIAFFDDDEEVSESVNFDSGDVILLLVDNIRDVNVPYSFRLNELYNDLSESGYYMICLTGSPYEEIGEWRELSMADYPVYTMDSSQLRSIARGNPAFVWMHDGVILYKTNLGVVDMDSVLESASLSADFDRELFVWLTIILLIVMTVVLLVNRSVLLIKFTKRLSDNKNKALTLQKISETNHKQINKMRKNIVAGNWKMNTTLAEGVALAKEVNEALATRTPNCDVVIGVPFTHLASVNAVIDADKLGLSAENCADKESGAYTGEVSAAMVASTGAKYVILGHSERRQYYHETAEILKEKVGLALANGLTPIFCIGEVLEERENGTYFDVVKAQVEGSLFELSAEDFGKIVLAYEPVWAIGTGKTATADQAEEIHAFIRKTIADKYGAEVAENTSILYGGSCKPSNAKELFAKPNVDGGLIGGAALKADSFMGIVDAF